MRPFFPSLAASVLVLGSAWAQSTNDSSSSMPQLPVGQIFKHFEYPYYQDGKLKFVGSATEAKGITLNRAETTDLKIDVYDQGAVTTTITSPKADLYVNEQILRTKNTVQIDRADMVATSQDCNFDLKTKKYVLRNNVKVVLKHFDMSPATPNGAAKPKATAAPAPAPTAPHPAENGNLMLESPGSVSDTNSAPLPPSSDTK